MGGILYAGVGRGTITPPVGIAHAGWGAQVHERAEGVEAEFHVTVLLARDDDAGCAIVEYDIGTLTVEEATRIRGLVAQAVGLLPGAVSVSYSHTHAGPNTQELNVRAGMELVPAYMETLVNQAVGAARQAQFNLRPALVGAGYGRSGVAVNRRLPLPGGRVVVSQNPAGYTDETVTVARIDAVDGSPIAAVVGYACHPITLAFQNRLLSPDYPGVVRGVVERLTGATCLFIQGCAGDQMPIEALTGDLTVHRRLGTRLGTDAASAYFTIDPAARRWEFDRVVESGAPLGLQRPMPAEPAPTGVRVVDGTVTMPLRHLGDPQELAAARSAIRDELSALRASGAPDPEIVDAMFRMKRAAMRSDWWDMFGDRRSVEIGLHGLRIGPFAMVGFPGEPFAQIGAAVRESSPFAVTLMRGYTNGWQGYVPTADAFPLGGYEVEWGSTFDVGAGEALVAAAGALLEQLR